ncbi:MAG TPA: hypothetical protein PLV56_00875, partial [Synergistales bacterium]|nr:hypothetical protein [Synergistales bacterium]
AKVLVLPSSEIRAIFSLCGLLIETKASHMLGVRGSAWSSIPYIPSLNDVVIIYCDFPIRTPGFMGQA